MSYCRNPIFFGTAACNQVPHATAAMHSASSVMRTTVTAELTAPVLCCVQPYTMRTSGLHTSQLAVTPQYQLTYAGALPPDPPSPHASGVVHGSVVSPFVSGYAAAVQRGSCSCCITLVTSWRQVLLTNHPGTSAA